MTVADVLSVNAAPNYWYGLTYLVLCAIVLFGMSRSAMGLIRQASGQDPIEAQALGFNVTKHKLTAFCISAVFSGMAGAMLVFYMGAASVDTLIDISIGVQIIIAAVLGGRRTILGAVLGAVFLDRESVVEGKRGDFGGGRIIKKKKTGGDGMRVALGMSHRTLRRVVER